MKRIALLALSTSAFAGEAKTIIETNVESPARTYFRSEASYVAEADYEGSAPRGTNKGSGSVWSGRLQLGVVRQLPSLRMLSSSGGTWQLRLGVDHERFEFDHDSALPLPSRLQHVAGVVALEYTIGRQIGVIIEARPGVYFENDIESNSWNCPVLFGVGIPINDRFTLAIAGRVDPLGKIPVIGGPGFIWKISDSVTLSAVPPEPRLTWTASDELKVWLGGEWAGGSFRTDKRANEPALSGAVVSYTDLRVGLGATWTRGHWSLEAGAGMSLDREWDYHRADRTFSTSEAAPFIKFAARAAW